MFLKRVMFSKYKINGAVSLKAKKEGNFLDSLNFIKIPSNVIYFFLGSFSMSQDRHFFIFSLFLSFKFL